MSANTAGALHKWHHDDYDVAKAQIMQHLGSLDDLEVFGRQVIVAVYIRPAVAQGGTAILRTTTAQTEDVYQGKAVLIVKCGPDAFSGDDTYQAAMFGARGKPDVGDWVFLRAADGLPISLCGDGSSRATMPDNLNREVVVFGWDGWPCRIVADDAIIARANKPHVLV